MIEEFGNEDIKGYLEIEGTSIEYPILQSDDNEFFLNKWKHIYVDVRDRKWNILGVRNRAVNNNADIQLKMVFVEEILERNYQSGFVFDGSFIECIFIFFWF